MSLEKLKQQLNIIIENIKDHGAFPKENDSLDFKQSVNIGNKENIEIFLINFAKDILAFANKNGGIILIGFKENQDKSIEEVGLSEKELKVLSSIDLNLALQKFEKITNSSISIDLQQFQICSKKFYSLIIEKSSDVLIPTSDFLEYKLRKGEIWYRETGKNEQANKSTSYLNKFIQIKANEKSKEFMEIWSNLLPEMVDINPKEVLILNPIQNKIYGFNKKDNTLSGSNIEIDQDKNGIFNIILQSITAGEIGKITNNEGKPIYKIIGEFLEKKEQIPLTTLHTKILEQSKYHLTQEQLKKVCYFLGWVKSDQFVIDNPEENIINNGFDEYLWIEVTNSVKGSKKIVFSPNAITELLKIIENKTKHKKIFDKILDHSKINKQ